jgi:hypothetical protein
MALLRHPHRRPALAQRQQEHRQQRERERQRSSPPPLSPCLARRRRSKRRTRSLRARERSQRAFDAQQSARGAACAACAPRAVTAREAQARGFAAQLRCFPRCPSPPRLQCDALVESRLVPRARHRNARRTGGRRVPAAAVAASGKAHPTSATLTPQRQRHSAPALRWGAARVLQHTRTAGHCVCAARRRGEARRGARGGRSKSP